ncbi:hypothetical protein WBJ53_20875 [Spirosoma sp. SC4-14]|uniref:hypothetical protein n=1 Tax=Spirosoma sp. SC4-14 TaxID=3128900 RepID=UPI0030D5583A
MQRFRMSCLFVVALTASLVAQAQDTTATTADAATKPPAYTYLALALSILALIGLVLLWWQNRLGWEKLNAERRSVSGSADGIRELSGRVLSLERDNKALLTKLKALESQIAQLREAQSLRVTAESVIPAMPAPAAEAKPVSRQAEAKATTPRPVSSQTQRPAPVPVAGPPAKLYARTVDVPGGFSVSSLVETPNRPMVFVITPTAPGQATFRVTDDFEAQRLALSDPYSYLSDACNYNSRPEANSRIHMISDGKLQLQGEKWHITEKAEISFYA